MIFIPKVSRPINRVFIHCSASDNPAHDDVAVIRDWHVNERNWSDVGYHAFICSDGHIQNGRPWDKSPAAQRGHNEGTIAICLHGLNSFTKDQRMALRRLCLAINKTYDVTFHGHCEVSSKSCPNFDYKEVIGLDERGYINKGV